MPNPAVLPAAEASLITLSPSLPCAMRRATGLRCGRPATVAWSDPIMLGLNTGSWYLIPICQDCARSALELYGQQPAEALPVTTKRPNGSLADISFLFSPEEAN